MEKDTLKVTIEKTKGNGGYSARISDGKTKPTFAKTEIEALKYLVERMEENSIRREERAKVEQEILHEQQKLVDGFGHPKDCESCK